MVEAGGFEPPSRSGFSRSSTCVSVLLSLAAASRRRPLLAAASASVLGSSRRRARSGPVRWNDTASYPADWVGAAGRLCLARKIRGVFRFLYRHKSPRVVQVQC